MKKLVWLVVILTAGIIPVYSAGKADDAARIVIKKTSKEVLELGAKKADDAIRYASRHVDDWGRAVVYKIDDVTRLLSHKADDIARIGIRYGDDVIYDFTKVHARRISRTLSTKTDNIARTVIDDIPREGLSKKTFRNIFEKKYGNDLAKDIVGYTRNNQKIQRVLRGTQISDANQYTLKRAKRIDNFLKTHKTTRDMVFPSGINLSPDDFAKMYNTGDLNGKSLQDIADLVKNKNTFNPAFTSANLPNTPKVEVNDWAIFGLNRTEQPNNYKIVRELYAKAGTPGGYDISPLNFYSQDEMLFATGLKTHVTDAVVETVMDRTGKTHNIIHIFEEIDP